MIFNVKDLEKYIRYRFNILGNIEIFMSRVTDKSYDVHWKSEDIDEYHYLKLDDYKSYLREIKLNDLGI